MKKYEAYQDYVIKDGKLIGEFEEMYNDYTDPWLQLEQNHKKTFVITLDLIKEYKCKRIIEIGCGLGKLTHQLQDVCEGEVLGVDISPKAILEAKEKYPECNFTIGDIMDFNIYEKFKPDCIVMAEITWYVLEKLKKFLYYFNNNMPDTYLIHLLHLFPKGIQKYGADYFVDLNGVLDYFNFDYYEYGQINNAKTGDIHSYFSGKPLTK